MAGAVRVGIIGGGWPGAVHARGYTTAGGFKVVAVADLIPDRRRKLMAEFQIAREYSEAKDLLADKEIDAVSICLPNHLHTSIVLGALKAGKHVICETPPAVTTAEARRMEKAAKKYEKVLLYGFQRRFGGHEQAARMAISKGLIGEPYHVRCVWTRTRGVPIGTGWYLQKQQSGGGALMDTGIHMLDLGWNLLGQPHPTAAFGINHLRLLGRGREATSDVEEAAFAVVRFEEGKSLELATSWAINQSPQQNGTVCRVHGTEGAIEVYTTNGAMLYRDFDARGKCKENSLKGPKTTHHAALMRHFRDCMAGKASPMPGSTEGIQLMQMIEAIYKSHRTGKSVSLHAKRHS
jgi:predicted dehydrogenase